MVYDSGDGYVLLVEAVGWKVGATSQTWTFANETWTNLTSLNDSPPDLISAGIAYDQADHEVVMFGGFVNNMGTVGNQTWIYRSGAWTDATNSDAPAPYPRHAASLAYDAQDGYVLLFGGGNWDASTTYNDTWKFQAGRWTELEPAGGRAPSARESAALAFDYAGNFTLLYGGYVYNGTWLRDSWRFEDGNWTLLTTPGGGPFALAAPKLISEPGSSSVLLEGCAAVGAPGDDLWLLDGLDWSVANVTDFGALANACESPVVPEASPGSALLLVTSGDLPCSSNTWLFESPVWSTLPNSTPMGPCAAYGTVAAYDAASGYVVAFGGSYQSASETNQTWTFSNDTWTNVTSSSTTAPSPRLYEGFVYDAADAEILLFGGRSSDGCGPSGVCGDTWEFSSGSWQNVDYHSTTRPSPRYFPAMAYDPQSSDVLLFGGSRGSQDDLGDTWSFSLGSWTNLTSNIAGTPHARDGASMTYDPTDSCVLMFGGLNYNSTAFEFLNDTWCYANYTWSSIRSIQSPPASETTAMVFNPAWNLTVLIDVATPNGMMWAFNGSEWAALPVGSSSYSPLPTALSSLIFDQGAGTLVIIGGSQSERSQVDAWKLGSTLHVDSFSASASSVETGGTVQLAVTTTGGSGWIDYAYSGLPPGCSSADASPLLCSPTAAVGAIIVVVEVTDRATHVVLQRNLTLQVTAGPAISQFIAFPSTIDLGQTVRFSASIAGGNGPFSFRYEGLPDGCTAGSGPTLSCTPLQPGSSTVEVIATDEFGITSSASTLLEVNPDPSVAYLDASPSTFYVGQATRIAVNVSGGTPPYAYAYAGLPAGCSLLPDRPMVNCTAITAESVLVGVFVTDAVGYEISQSVAVSVFDYPQLVGFSASEDPLTVGNSTVLVTSAIGGVPPLYYSYSGLPPGCEGENLSAISCTPSSAGNYSAQVTVHDALGNGGDAVLVLTVSPIRATSPSKSPPTGQPSPTASPNERLLAPAWLILASGAAIGSIAAVLGAGARRKVRRRG